MSPTATRVIAIGTRAVVLKLYPDGIITLTHYSAESPATTEVYRREE